MGMLSPTGGRKPQQRVIPFGKYLLLQRIAIGGMAEVFLAKSFGIEGFEKIIAIKRILPTMAEDDDFIEMFIDEAKIAGHLSHANIVPIFELGKIGESHYIAMEYVWGKDLLQMMNRFRRMRSRMDPVMVAHIASKMCEALEYAHRKRDRDGVPLGLIHRDISPQNILVSYDGAVKLIDFGIAKATARTTKTQAGVLKGKFGYMSPEQVRGKTIDHRSDIFAVGTCMYEMLTADRLFLGESDFSTLERVRHARVDPPSSVVPNCPADFDAIIMRALAQDPQQRWQSAGELHEALQEFLVTQRKAFTSNKLATWMRQAFAPEISKEKALLDSFAEVARPMPPPAPPKPAAPQAISIGDDLFDDDDFGDDATMVSQSPFRPDGVSTNPSPASAAAASAAASVMHPPMEELPEEATTIFFSMDDIGAVLEDDDDEEDENTVFEARSFNPSEPAAVFGAPKKVKSRVPTMVPGLAPGPSVPPVAASVPAPAHHAQHPPPAAHMPQAHVPQAHVPQAAPQAHMPQAHMPQAQATPFGQPPMGGAPVPQGTLPPGFAPGGGPQPTGPQPVAHAPGGFAQPTPSLNPGTAQGFSQPPTGGPPSGGFAQPPGPGQRNLETMELRAVDAPKSKKGLIIGALVAVTALAALGLAAMFIFRSEPGAIEIRTTPSGAMVAIDSVQRGPTPLRVDRVPSGARELQITADGHRTETRTVNVLEGETMSVAIDLTPLAGAAPSPTAVAVATPTPTPAAPAVTPTPAAEPAVAPAPDPAPPEPEVAAPAPTPMATRRTRTEERPRVRRRTETTEMDDAPTPMMSSGITRIVRNTPEEIAPMMSTMTSMRGGSGSTLVINTIPWARVFVDGRDTGRNTPIRSLSVSPGRHRIGLRTPDGEMHNITVNVEEGETERVSRRFN